MWSSLFGWTAVGIYVTVLIGFGWVTVSIPNPQFNAAQGAFALAAAILLTRFGWWIAVEHALKSHSRAQVGVFSFVVCGAVGCLWALSLFWVDGLRPVQAQPTSEKATPLVEPRTLSEYQRTRLRAVFGRPEYKGQIVVILVSGDESWTYARDIASVFENWKVLGPFSADKSELAMDVQVSSSNLVPPPSQTPQMVLSSFQFVQLKGRDNLIRDPDVPPNVTVVWVGPESPPGVTSDNHVPQSTHLQEILKANSVTLPFHQVGREKPTSHVSAPNKEDKPPTLLELFGKDLPSMMKTSDDAITIKWKTGGELHIKRQLYLDFIAKTEFVGFYIPASDPVSSADTANACMVLDESNAVKQTLDQMPKKVFVSGGYGDQMTSINDLTFSGRVLIYHEAFLSITEKADIIRAYAAKHYDVQFRGPDYLGDQTIAWYHGHGVPKPKPQ